MVNSYHYSSTECKHIFDSNIPNAPPSLAFMRELCDEVDDIVARDQYSQPMLWIGIYIAIASFLCTAAMAADLSHGFLTRKIWFPCKYFSLNAASITMIAVAMKLPMDLSSPMPGAVDQLTKLGSMAFMCTMMANLMPSLASMGNKSLLANVTGLAILVITMIVNICIQINTNLISHEINNAMSRSVSNVNFHFAKMACIYVVLMILLLTVMISSTISIPIFKQILELKYREIRTMVLYDLEPQDATLEKLRQHVRRHWIMVKTGSPQFVMANNPLSFAAGVICVIAIVINTSLFLKFSDKEVYVAFRSDYKLSMLAIYITQFAGCIMGGITPVFRCFTILSFRFSSKTSRKFLLVFTVEKYWTKKLCEWKDCQITFLSSGCRSRTLVHKSKAIIMSLLIIFQKIIVVSCKMLRLIPVAVLIFVAHCFLSWNSLREKLCPCTPNIASKSTDDVTNKEDLGIYVLQLEDKIGLSDHTLQGILKSMDVLIQKIEKDSNHNNLIKLLDKSTAFRGVANFDTDQVQPLLPVVLPYSWSLPIVTLTCIAISLPNIEKNVANRLFKSVGEGLIYTHLVEESLINSAEENVINQKAATSLWHEVEAKCKWLDENLERSAFYGKTPREIVQSFSDKAKEMVINILSSTEGKLEKKLFAANSMYRISQTILLSYGSNIDPITEGELFIQLYGMISDIMVACFTNIPKVIMMKCHESVIEKREASVEVATMLLGRTMHIMKTVEPRELPSMDPDKMAYIDEWRLHMKQSIP
uniref:uncharacterized protein LOC122610924 n=1 Tax=Erigeron canadensis TaxID=72917 RepID=UPI001CB8EF3D|nr:uncharacterized protein LOC122610924 [Erigeron canadensis]